MIDCYEQSIIKLSEIPYTSIIVHHILIDDDEDSIKPKVENLKNPHFVTSNGCAEHYPIWRTPSFVGGRLAEVINCSMGGERNPNRLETRNVSHLQNEAKYWNTSYPRNEMKTLKGIVRNIN